MTCERQVLKGDWQAVFVLKLFVQYSGIPSGEFELLASVPTAPSAGSPALNIYLISLFQ